MTISNAIQQLSENSTFGLTEYNEALSAFLCASNEHQVVTNWFLRNLEFYLPFHNSLAILSVNALPHFSRHLADSLHGAGYWLRYLSLSLATPADFDHSSCLFEHDDAAPKFDFIIFNRTLPRTEELDVILIKASKNLYSPGFLLSIDDAGDSTEQLHQQIYCPLSSPRTQLLTVTELHNILREQGFCFHTESLPTEVTVRTNSQRLMVPNTVVLTCIVGRRSAQSSSTCELLSSRLSTASPTNS